MRRPDRSRGGFTLIEVVAATVLLVITASGFMAMAAASAGLLAREHRMERASYQLSSMAYSGQGEPTGETLTVRFIGDGERGTEVEEVFDEYSVMESWEDMENTMTYYRHRQR